MMYTCSTYEVNSGTCILKTLHIDPALDLTWSRRENVGPTVSQYWATMLIDRYVTAVYSSATRVRSEWEFGRIPSKRGTVSVLISC